MLGTTRGPRSEQAAARDRQRSSGNSNAIKNFSAARAAGRVLAALLRAQPRLQGPASGARAGRRARRAAAAGRRDAQPAAPGARHGAGARTTAPPILRVYETDAGPQGQTVSLCRERAAARGVTSALSGAQARFRLGAVRSLFAATRRAAASATRAHVTSSSGSSNSRSGARQKERSMVQPFFS